MRERLRSSDWLCLSAVLLLCVALLHPMLLEPAPTPRPDGWAQLAERPLAEPAIAAAQRLPTPPIQSQAPASLEQLQARIEAVLVREQVPGAGLAMIDAQGRRWAGGIGHADLERRIPVTADTAFRVGSITKSVIGLAVLRLVERGQLSLDAPLAELMPEIEIRNAWEAERPLTLAHALEHSAGFDDMRFNEFYGHDEMTPAEALALNPRSREVRWRPGSRMAYSNPGYTLAAHALEKATGQPWERVVRREVLEPLGMRATDFRRSEAIAARLATGYTAPGVVEPYRAIAHRPAGALMASARELLPLVELGLGRGEHRGEPLLGPEAFARLERAETLDYTGTDEVYGLGNYGTLVHPGALGRGHDGGMPGFLSHHSYYPQLGVGYVMLLNGTYSSRAYLEIRQLVFDYLTRETALPGAPPIVEDPESVAAATGWYDAANPRHELGGFLERALLGAKVEPLPRELGPDGLLLTFRAGVASIPVQLVPAGDGGFRHPSQGGVSVRVTRDRTGEPVVVTGMGYFESGSASVAWLRRGALIAAFQIIRLSPYWMLGALMTLLLGLVRGQSLDWDLLKRNALPVLAALLGHASIVLFELMFARDAFTDRNPLSLGVCVTSLAFALSSAAALVVTLRALASNKRMLAGPTAAAFASFGLSAWLAWHGMIGLRIWAW